MQKIIGVIVSMFCLFVSSIETFAYLNMSDCFMNVFSTNDYVFNLDAEGGYFDDYKISIQKNKTLLPIPFKKGYMFSGYRIQDSNTVVSETIDDVGLINKNYLSAQWDVQNFHISYELNGGNVSNLKTNYTVEEEFSLPIPIKKGYLFAGWTGTDLISPTKIVIIKNDIGDRNYVANWSTDSYYVDVNSVVDGLKNDNGYNGYTFDVYVNDILVANDVIDWGDYVGFGSAVRVVTKEKIGHTSGFDSTITVGTESNEINPIWTRNTYPAHFYVGNNFWMATNNLYGDYVSTPNVSNVGQFGYDDNFYRFVDFSPWTSWYQQEYAIGFTVNIIERTCRATFGVMPNESNARAQQNKFHNAGYEYCNVNSTNTHEVVCNGTYSQILSAYNGAWNGILPTSGSGFSSYRDMACDSGWTTYSRR